MGCWNETCMLTNLPILIGNPTVILFLQQNYTPHAGCHPDGYFRPVSLPIEGLYDDYGRLEGIKRNPVALRLLAETEFYTENHVHGFQHVGVTIAQPDVGYDEPISGFQPVDMKDLTDEKLWEAKLIELIEAARQEHLYMKDPNTKTGFSLVRLAMIRKEFMDFGLDAVKDITPDVTQNDYITYRIGLADVFRTAIREQTVTNDDIKTLTGLHVFMDQNRIAWHPTCGSGSQRAIDDDYQLDFYRKILQTAECFSDPDL